MTSWPTWKTPSGKDTRGTELQGNGVVACREPIKTSRASILLRFRKSWSLTNVCESAGGFCRELPADTSRRRQHAGQIDQERNRKSTQKRETRPAFRACRNHRAIITSGTLTRLCPQNQTGQHQTPGFSGRIRQSRAGLAGTKIKNQRVSGVLPAREINGTQDREDNHAG